MDIHKNARLSFRSRESLARLVIEQGATRKAAAAAFRVSAKTAAKWIVRFRVAGLWSLPLPPSTSVPSVIAFNLYLLAYCSLDLPRLHFIHHSRRFSLVGL